MSSPRLMFTLLVLALSKITYKNEIGLQTCILNNFALIVCFLFHLAYFLRWLLQVYVALHTFLYVIFFVLFSNFNALKFSVFEKKNSHFPYCYHHFTSLLMSLLHCNVMCFIFLRHSTQNVVLFGVANTCRVKYYSILLLSWEKELTAVKICGRNVSGRTSSEGRCPWKNEDREIIILIFQLKLFLTMKGVKHLYVHLKITQVIRYLNQSIKG